MGKLGLLRGLLGLDAGSFKAFVSQRQVFHLVVRLSEEEQRAFAAAAVESKDVEALNNRCWTRAVIGDLQGALKDCNEALRLRPNFVDALDSRGLVNLKSGLAKNAIADFDAALRINPRLTSSLYGRGLAKQRNGSISEGELDISNAKAMDPNIVKEFASYGVR